MPFWSALVFPSCRFGRCLCSLVAVLVGACVPRLPFWSVLVFPGCRFALVAVLVVLRFLVNYRFGRCLCSLVAVLVGACLAAFVRACSMVQKSRCLRTVAVGSVCGGRRLVGSFSWAGVGGLRVCFPGSGRDLSLMWGLPGRGCFSHVVGMFFC